jgi:hypothetical protein
VVERDGKPVVFVVQDGRAKQVPVTRGAKIGELLSVQGVKPGDVVVLAPSEKLGDGSKSPWRRSDRKEVTAIMSAAPLVSIRHLAKSYQRGAQTVPVLSDISLDIAEATLSR